MKICWFGSCSIHIRFNTQLDSLSYIQSNLTSFIGYCTCTCCTFVSGFTVRLPHYLVQICMLIVLTRISTTPAATMREQLSRCNIHQRLFRKLTVILCCFVLFVGLNSILNSNFRPNVWAGRKRCLNFGIQRHSLQLTLHLLIYHL